MLLRGSLPLTLRSSRPNVGRPFFNGAAGRRWAGWQGCAPAPTLRAGRPWALQEPPRETKPGSRLEQAQTLSPLP